MCLNEIQARELRGEDSLASVLEVKILEAIVENYQEKTNKPVLCIGEICSMLLFVENSYLLERTIKQAIESEQLEIEDCRLLTNQLKEAQ